MVIHDMREKMNITDRVRSALAQYRTGHLDEAERICRKIVGRHPTHVGSIFLLGLIHLDRRDYSGAIRYLKSVIEIDPENAGAYHFLGNAYVFRGSSFFDEAGGCYQKCLQIDPNYRASYNNLGNIFQEKGKIDEAIDCFQKALQLDPERDDTLYNLGNALQAKERLDEAITCYEKALRLNSNDAEIFYSLGMAFKGKNMLGNAIACYQNAVRLAPEHADAHLSLGHALMMRGELRDAIEHLQISLRMYPDLPRALLYLGNCFFDQGKTEEAEKCYRRAMQKNPDDWLPQEALLMAINYDANEQPQNILSEHMKFAKKIERSVRPSIHRSAGACGTDHRIKIGYVSPDLRCHSVSYFFEPVLAAHNRKCAEIFCYSDVSVNLEDEVTNRLKGYTDEWRNIANMSDGEAAELIQNDGIDILVDLAGYTDNNRLLLFARRPAPVQVSWIGYPATTGLSAMDYKIVDRYTDPPGMTEQFYTEKLIRMPESFLCYLPDSESPEVGDLPALSSGRIVFGSFNNFAKLSLEVMEMWAKILKEVPDSCLIMKAKSLSDESTRRYVADLFAERGVTAERLDLLSWEPLTKRHLAAYNRIDIGLDTYPYNGTTTTCEALWMGVPVVTLAGKTHACRVGLSLLSNIGLPKLAAKAPDEYIDIAVTLAGNLSELRDLRENLRSMMMRSSLMNAERFVGNLENCYRGMWKEWCNRGSQTFGFP
jgi:protein O-GlcNAc transferase